MFILFSYSIFLLLLLLFLHLKIKSFSFIYLSNYIKCILIVMLTSNIIPLISFHQFNSIFHNPSLLSQVNKRGLIIMGIHFKALPKIKRKEATTIFKKSKTLGIHFKIYNNKKIIIKGQIMTSSV